MKGDKHDLTKRVAFQFPLMHLGVGMRKYDILITVSSQAGSKRGIIRKIVD